MLRAGLSDKKKRREDKKLALKIAKKEKKRQMRDRMNLEEDGEGEAFDIEEEM